MLSLGTVLEGRFRVDRMLEIGALEGQYRGWDLQTNDSIIIKELIPQPDLDPAALLRLKVAFDADAEALASLHHPHIVRVLAHFFSSDDAPSQSPQHEAGSSAYVILQAVAGQSLADLIEREGAIKEGRVIVWATQILEALAYAHHRGILHRDIKPDNILITPDDRALVTNFEAVALWDRSDPRTWTAERVMGVPQYAPPERWGNRTSQIDVRGDIYSLGATLYHALTGEQPLTAGERTSNPYRFLQVKALAPRVNSQTRSVILKAMELPLDKRYQSAAAMSEAIKQDERADALRNPPPAPFLPMNREAPWSKILGLLGSAVVIAFAGILGMWISQRITLPRVRLPSVSSTVEPVGLEQMASGERAPPDDQPDAIATPVDADGVPDEPTLPTGTVAVDGTVEETRVLSPAQLLGDLAPGPPAGWGSVVADSFDDNRSGWIISDYEDDWGSVTRRITDGTYRWEIDAVRAVGRWCTPDLTGNQGIVGDFFVSVEAQRQSGPASAAYGLVLRHTEGAYYLFSVRDDGHFQFSLWNGFAWQPVIDWTQTTAVVSGGVNRLAVMADGRVFELYINDEFVSKAESDDLAQGEAGLSISTAATDGVAVFVFDNFELWGPF